MWMVDVDTVYENSSQDDLDTEKCHKFINKVEN